jgi:tetratricopeptide (TPR) repeat protein
MKCFLTVMAVSVLALAGCSTPSAPEYNPRPAYQTSVSSGWNMFVSHNYALAATEFRNALELDVSRSWPEAYIGLGWSLAMQDSLAKAVNDFNSALARVPKSAQDSADIYAGLSLSYRDISPPNFTLVRDNALAALGINPQYVFQNQTTINKDDLRAVLAEAYFNLGQYDLAAKIADPAGSLDPKSLNYATDLLTKINTLLTLSREGD